MSRSSLLSRVRQVASPRKSAKTRLERAQKINKVSKSLFGPVMQSEFKRYAQVEMNKYQLQASVKWNFDFVKESPITCANSRFKWEPSNIIEMPKFYHQISYTSRLLHHHSSGEERANLYDEHENICPLSKHIISIETQAVPVNRRTFRAPSSASTSLATARHCSSQRKITDFLKVRKRRMSTTVCTKKAAAEF